MSEATTQMKIKLLRDYAGEQIKEAWQECQFALLSVVACRDDAMNIAIRRSVVFLAEAAWAAAEIHTLKAGEAGDDAKQP
jgi:hypothetical protein